MDIIAIAAQEVMQFTLDYLQEDVAFCDEYMRIFNKAQVYFKNFDKKLKETVDKSQYIKKLAGEKYLFMLQSSIKLSGCRLDFNRNNERERADSNYYEIILNTINVIEALLYLAKEEKDAWIKNYFFAMKIQMRAICKIFEREMGGVYGKRRGV